MRVLLVLVHITICLTRPRKNFFFFIPKYTSQSLPVIDIIRKCILRIGIKRFHPGMNNRNGDWHYLRTWWWRSSYTLSSIFWCCCCRLYRCDGIIDLGALSNWWWWWWVMLRGCVAGLGLCETTSYSSLCQGGEGEDDDEELKVSLLLNLSTRQR